MNVIQLLKTSFSLQNGIPDNVSKLVISREHATSKSDWVKWDDDVLRRLTKKKKKNCF